MTLREIMKYIESEFSIINKTLVIYVVETI